jgi:hypothetical protein
MVREDNFERLRDADFSSARSDVDAARIRMELNRYSASSVARLSRLVREQADFVRYVDRLERVYHDVIARQERDSANADQEQRFASDYLLTLSPLLKRMDESLKRLDIPLATASLFLDAKAKQAALQAALDRPKW